ncbi:MAG: hypothetical protein FWH00_03065, partial [Oscillospiraceae bacterium]|nr:hypothetical protein [Oscillospiraceae bacterium]
MKVLTCNVGSTSLKFKLYIMPQKTLLAQSRIERVGTNSAIYHYENPDKDIAIQEDRQHIPDYLTGITRFLDDLTGVERGAIGSIGEIEAVGFKTVLSK